MKIREDGKKELLKKLDQTVKDYAYWYRRWQLDRTNLNYRAKDKHEIALAILKWQKNRLKKKYKKEYIYLEKKGIV